MSELFEQNAADRPLRLSGLEGQQTKQRNIHTTDSSPKNKSLENVRTTAWLRLRHHGQTHAATALKLLTVIAILYHPLQDGGARFSPPSNILHVSRRMIFPVQLIGHRAVSFCQSPEATVLHSKPRPRLVACITRFWTCADIVDAKHTSFFKNISSALKLPDAPPDDEEDSDHETSPAAATQQPYVKLQQDANWDRGMVMDVLRYRLVMVHVHFFSCVLASMVYHGFEWSTASWLDVAFHFAFAAGCNGTELLKMQLAPGDWAEAPVQVPLPVDGPDPPPAAVRVQHELLRRQEERLPQPPLAYTQFVATLDRQDQPLTAADVDWSAMSVFSVYASPPDWAAVASAAVSDSSPTPHYDLAQCVECEDQLLFKVTRPDAWDWEAVLQRITERAVEDSKPAEFYVLYNASVMEVLIDPHVQDLKRIAEHPKLQKAGMDMWHLRQVFFGAGDALVYNATACFTLALLTLLTFTVACTSWLPFIPRGALLFLDIVLRVVPLLLRVHDSTTARWIVGTHFLFLLEPLYWALHDGVMLLLAN